MDEQNNNMDQTNQSENMAETPMEQPVMQGEEIEDHKPQTESQAPASTSFLDKILGFFKGTSN